MPVRKKKRRGRKPGPKKKSLQSIRDAQPRKSSAGRPVKYTDNQIIKALQASGGLVQLAARKLGCDPVTIYNRIKTVECVGAVLKVERETFVDEAEGALRKAVKNGESWAILYALRCLGKDRGYLESHQHAHTHEAVVSGEVKHVHEAVMLSDDTRQALLEKVRALRPSVPPQALPALGEAKDLVEIVGDADLPQSLVPVAATVVDGDTCAPRQTPADCPDLADSGPESR